MRARILDAAIRVLSGEGALGFTTTRVAEEAGISVGSVYQYFPNKHALVIALHRDAIRHGWERVQDILDDPGLQPRGKVAGIAAWFFATESAEVRELGPLFEDMSVFLHHGEDDSSDHFASDAGLDVRDRFTRFVAESSRQPAANAAFGAELLMTTLEAVGKSIAARPLTHEERHRWALSTAAMLCDYLGI
jgi:AcrR family transcriptional regulator